MSREKLVLEIALESVEDALLAQRAGADRIELCAGLDVGGLTPSAGQIAAVCAAVRIPVLVMIRPRPGGFCYSQGELDIMQRDIAHARAAGAAGVVSGVLLPEGRVNENATRALRDAAGGLQFVFHRAFDLTPEPLEALHAIRRCGVTRLLTSGQAPRVAPPSPGADLVRQLVALAGGLEIMACGGVRADNVRALLQLTGVCQVHAACRRTTLDPSAAAGRAPLGFGVASDAEFGVLEVEALRALRAALD